MDKLDDSLVDEHTKKKNYPDKSLDNSFLGEIYPDKSEPYLPRLETPRLSSIISPLMLVFILWSNQTPVPD